MTTQMAMNLPGSKSAQGPLARLRRALLRTELELELAPRLLVAGDFNTQTRQSRPGSRTRDGRSRR